MESEARYTLVGTSVLVLVALLAAAFVWLLASGQRRDVQTYRIYFTKQSLEGPGQACALGAGRPLSSALGP